MGRAARAPPAPLPRRDRRPRVAARVAPRPRPDLPGRRGAGRAPRAPAHATAALALLYARARTGEAGRVEVALADAATPFAAPLAHGLTAPGGLLGGALPAYGVYAARTGWVAVGALEPHFRDALCAALDVDPTDVDLAARLRERFAARDAAEWETWARGRDLPLVAVRGNGQENG
ncbi:CoA transferase [Roseisolibacter sp. H3M3-2]|uniref:CoA transferase n=1 Tax=Roseisolibacter sp. H3M3-2 TaxID=3031323 RepID=UPI0031F318DD